MTGNDEFSLLDVFYAISREEQNINSLVNGAESGLKATLTYSWPIYVQIQAILVTLNGWIGRQKILLDAKRTFRFSIQQTIPWFRRHRVLGDK